LKWKYLVIRQKDFQQFQPTAFSVAFQRRSLPLILGLAAAVVGEGVGAQESNAQNPDPVIVQKIKGVFGIGSGPRTPAGVEKIKLTTGTPKREVKTPIR
jgi:hypothetical protein